MNEWRADGKEDESDKFIPVCEPTFEGNEEKYVLDCVRSGWVSSQGKYIEEFEKKFSEFCQVKYAVACSNGTTALHLALEAAGVGRGDEVIIPAFTMIATINSVIYAGARPVLVDSEPETWNMDPNKVEEKVSSKTKAIMVMHTYGHPVDMDPIMEIARRHNLIVIEDAAEAHGAEYKGRRVGSLGDIAAFSFYANKIITTGEGGMVVTNNLEWVEKARRLRNHAFGVPRYVHKELGYNYRMTNIQAAIGLAQIERADNLVDCRRKNAQLYNSLLSKVKGVTIPVEKEWAKNVYWMYGILISPEYGISAAELRKRLAEKGIDTRQFFIPMNKQPLYSGTDGRCPDLRGSYPVAEMLAEQGFYLPSSSSLNKEQIIKIAKEVEKLGRET
jgi:perosamine synthetase